jgi:DNA-binding NarL/FixJ family response regulator
MMSGINGSECFEELGRGDGGGGGRGGEPYHAIGGGVSRTAGPAATDKSRARIALIDPRPLTRISISRLLSGDSPAHRRAEDFAVWPASSPEEFFSVSPFDGEADLIVLNLGAACASEENSHSDIERLVNECPGIPLVLLSDCQNPKHILCALRGSVRGYIPSSLASSMLVQALRLIRAGGMFIPPNVLPARSGPEAMDGGSETGREAPRDFTPRQTEVFQLLRKGKSNKVIAYELGMQESTVKVHVRQIMRKLKATNRTHAAFLAARLTEDGF